MKINWDQIPKFEPKFKKTKEYKKLKKLIKKAKINANSKWQKDFCKSVKKYLKTNGELSEKQVAVLENILYPPIRYTPEPRFDEAAYERDREAEDALDSATGRYHDFRSTNYRRVAVYSQDFGGDTNQVIGYNEYRYDHNSKCVHKQFVSNSRDEYY